MWEIPLAQLNQLVHVHLRQHGCDCRWRGALENLDDQFDSLCAKFGGFGPDLRNEVMPQLRVA